MKREVHVVETVRGHVNDVSGRRVTAQDQSTGVRDRSGGVQVDLEARWQSDGIQWQGQGLRSYVCRQAQQNKAT